MPQKVQPSLDVRWKRGTWGANVTATPYEDLDLVGGLITFSDAIPQRSPGKVRSLEVRGARLLDHHDSAVPTAGFALALFRQAPSTVGTDEVAVALSDANADFMIDFIHFPATARTHVMDLGNSIFYKASMPNGPITCVLDDVDADNNPLEDLALYGMLQVLGVWTPASTTPPTIDLYVVTD